MDTSIEATFDYLKSKYGRTVISKKELAKEMNISLSTLDTYISKGMGLPKYKKLGTSKNARLAFNIFDVATYLTSNQIKTM